jgi:hypothetical protein
VDRLDTWLNAQRGWRRLALIGATLYAPTFMTGFYTRLCLGLWAGGASRGPTRPALAIGAILAVPAALGLGSVTAVIHARNARNPNRKQPLLPFLMWRTTALFWLMLATSLSATLVVDQSSSAASHRLLGGLSLIFALAVIALTVEILRYSGRFARARIE